MDGPHDGQVEHDEAAAADERGRDLTLLALALPVLNEAIFVARMVWLGTAAVPSLGRFALITGLAYMTWQGFAVSRWVLVALAAAALVAAPWALADAVQSGSIAFGLVMTATVAAYAVAGWLLAFSPDVRRQLTYRAELRNRDVFRG